MKSFQQAIKERMANTYNSWPNPRSGAGSPNSAEERFKNIFFSVNSEPSFRISGSTKVYTIGSCFARNVEQFLLKSGIDVPTTSASVDPLVYISKPRFSNTILNKYNPHTMAAEILRGIGDLTYPDRGIMSLSEGQFFDPQASHTGIMNREQVDKVRDELDRISSLILTSEVFLFTLGLTETWFDTETGIAFNQINPALMRPIRNRLGFRNVTVSESYDVLSGAFLKLKSAVPNAKIVVTVSPVPLLQTFTPNDIVAANSYSKATLRCVAQMLTDTLDFVDYFPSYEMVLNSPRSSSWAVDQAHVTDSVVSHVISVFMERYLNSGD